MNIDAILDPASSLEMDDVRSTPLCMSCHEQASLRIVVAELLYKNQLLRFELCQLQALVGQLRLAFDEVQVHSASAAELQGALNGLDALLHPELGF